MKSESVTATAETPRENRPKAEYLPILGSLLGIISKSVVNIKTKTSEEDCAGAWTEPNKKTKQLEKHLYHHGSGLGEDARSDGEVVISFEYPVLNPLRTTLHLNRNSLPMAAGRMSEEQPFGLSLENQYYLNLVYASEQKSAGFEPLFIKVQPENGVPLYVRISVSPKGNDKRSFLIIIASLVKESEAPAHLVSCDLLDPKRTTRMQLRDSLRAKYFSR